MSQISGPRSPSSLRSGSVNRIPAVFSHWLGATNGKCHVHTHWQISEWRCQALGQLCFHSWRSARLTFVATIKKHCFINWNKNKRKNKTPKYYSGVCTWFKFTSWNYSPLPENVMISPQKLTSVLSFPCIVSHLFHAYNLCK